MPEPAEINIANTEAGEPTRLSGTFVSGELEGQYRQKQLREDLTGAGIVVSVTVLGVLVFIPADYRLFGFGMPFPAIFGVRLGIVALSILVWRKLRSAAAALQPRQFDRALLLWVVVIAVAQVYVSFTRPASYTGHFLVHLTTILLTYCVLPLSLLLQAVPALIMSGGMLACMWMKPPADGLTTNALCLALMSANVLGSSISRQLQISKRRLFLAFLRETQLRVGLENTLAELKTLRGIIPICAHCKNIRDDVGSWHQLEEYISHHSDAEFSHGICPICVDKFFAEE
ncbi:hypothetical protein ACXR0O_11245 [Verrucomicrobiota bacterium sgz303538]